MKKALLTVFIVLVSIRSFAQITSDENKSLHSITNSGIEAFTYKLYPTTNMWTFIKLNTRNGMMWQVQFDVEGENRFETSLNALPLVENKEEVDNRFALYPTQNSWNFILLDQINGSTWQIQWSQDAENRMILPID